LTWRKAADADSGDTSIAGVRRAGGSSRTSPSVGAAACYEVAMVDTYTAIKICPVCGVDMLRVPTDGCALVFRCCACLTEIVKPVPRTRDRRRPSRARERRSAWGTA
jgi:hypothetical protein